MYPQDMRIQFYLFELVGICYFPKNGKDLVRFMGETLLELHSVGQQRLCRFIPVKNGRFLRHLVPPPPRMKP